MPAPYPAMEVGQSQTEGETETYKQDARNIRKVSTPEGDSLLPWAPFLEGLLANWTVLLSSWLP